MRDDRLNNLKGEMKSLSSMQAMVKYFINPENKDTFFVNYEPYVNPANDNLHMGAISKMPHLVMTEMLNKLVSTRNDINGKEITEYPFGKQDTEDFLKKNAYSFLSICPKEFAIKCPQDVLKDMANGKYTSVEVQKLSIKEFGEGGHNRENRTIYDSFNAISSMVAKLIMNTRQIDQQVDISQVVDAFVLSEKYSTKYKSEKLSSGYNFDEKNVCIFDNMFTNPARDSMSHKTYDKKNLFENIDRSVIDFIKNNLNEVTKGMSPFIAFDWKDKKLKDTVSFFKNMIKNYDGPVRDVTVAEEKTNLQIKNSSVLKNFVDDARDTVANDVLENDTLSKPVGNEAIDTQNHSTDEMEIC